MLICEEDCQKIDHWVAKFPAGKQQSAVLMALKIVQDRHGWLSDALLDAVANYLDMMPATVYEVASFYSMYRREPTGTQELKVCTSLSCCLNGATDVIHYLEKQLDIKLGEMTADKRFTLNEAECLGACQHAPVVIVNDETYHHQVSPEKLASIISEAQHE
jgi:NADH-quinone oxidoreductase subunit E